MQVLKISELMVVMVNHQITSSSSLIVQQFLSNCVQLLVEIGEVTDFEHRGIGERWKCKHWRILVKIWWKLVLMVEWWFGIV